MPKRPRTLTQSTPGGSRAVSQRPAAPKPKKLTRVATHKEDMTAKMTARAEEQEDLDRRCKVREETFTLPIVLLLPSCQRCSSGEATLPDQAHWRVLPSAAEAEV